MTTRKKIHRARRHTLEMLAQAERAIESGELALASKLVHRAMEAGFMNPRVHADAALLLHALGRADEAEAAARRALELAPGAELARLVARQLGLQDHAEPRSSVAPVVDVERPPGTPAGGAFALAAAEPHLLRDGAVAMAAWLLPEQCEILRTLDPAGPAFVAARPLATPAGSLHYAWLRDGALPWLEVVFTDLYVCAARLANALQGRLGLSPRFPLLCPAPPAHVERAVRYQFAGGAVLAARRDPGDRATFPLRALLALGPAPAAVALVDVRPGKRRERVCQVPVGGAAWFCARERPVSVGGVLGLQTVTFELRGCGDAAVLLTSWADVVATQ